MHPQPPSGLPGKPTSTSGLAITSLICGILSFFIPVLLSLVAIVCGHWSRACIKKSRGRLLGKGLALAGLICAYTSLVLVIGAVAWMVNLHEESQRTSKEEIATEIQRGKELYSLVKKYEIDHGKFPDTLGELVEKGYVHSLDHLQPVHGGNWIYFKGLTSKSDPSKYFIRSDHHMVVIYVNGTDGDRNLSYTLEPTDFPVRGHEPVRE